MALSFSCQCGEHLEIDDQFAGQAVQCPTCAKVVTAPSKRPRVTVIAPPPVKPRPAPVRPVVVRDEASDDSENADYEPQRSRNSSSRKSRARKNKQSSHKSGPNWNVVGSGVFGMILMAGVVVLALFDNKLHYGAMIFFVLSFVGVICGLLGISGDDED